MKKKLSVTIIGAAVLALALTGCAGTGPTTGVDGGWVRATRVHLPDGRSVICVVGDSGGALQCDWRHAK